MKKVLTLCIIHKNTHVLLGMKKRGFGEGRWNGFGGKVQSGETILSAAKRELYEEAGIQPKNMRKAGIIEFEFKGDPQILQVHVFIANEFQGKPQESEEMKPRWFGVDRIPYRKMWPDDKHWLPLALSGKKFKAKFWFEGFDKIVDKDIHIA
jgi:8-oxo-dGTP diphosphatase / 2-hydroxy-dATP diphosphatase